MMLEGFGEGFWKDFGRILEGVWHDFGRIFGKTLPLSRWHAMGVVLPEI